jgi:hypothetical protein
VHGRTLYRGNSLWSLDDDNLHSARLRLGKLVAPVLLDIPMDGKHFLAYVEQILIPELTPGDVVVIDNLPTDKVVDVRAAIEAAGTHLRYSISN